MNITVQEVQDLLNKNLSLCDGSIVKVIKTDKKEVVVQLEGACKGCPGAQLTVNDSIETIIKNKFPYIEQVILDTSIDEELIAFAKKLLKRGK